VNNAPDYLIPDVDMPDCEVVETDDGIFLRDNRGDYYARAGECDQTGEIMFRKLDDDEAHEIEMGQWTDYDRRADYADRECAA
jgi:hypothetical protein